MRMSEKESLELSIIMPCLNEENAVGVCVEEAKGFIRKYNISGEILVVDNGSCDASAAIAERHGARVVVEPRKGYGNAIMAGMASSKGRVLIIGDSDTTYDFLHLEAIYDPLSKGTCDMVIGNRYEGGIEPGSMPWSHKWGGRFLSFCGRLGFCTDVYDFHCGLRGIVREAAERLDFQAEGMEFATEMIAEAVRNELCILQVPVVLRRCKYKRKSKLKTVRDGFSHLNYIIKNNVRGGKK